jgi:hypothetical protein
VKVFISHQKTDSDQATLIAARLRTHHQIDSYLDVIDPYLASGGSDLGDHIRDEMGKCTQLLAVVSASTKTSWWVPWEIGVATEKTFPLATFANTLTEIPEYLRKWPYLTTMAHLDEYAKVSKEVRQTLVQKRATFSESYARTTTTKDFFRILKSRLGQ